MKNSEVIQRVQSLYSKGVESDDTRLSSRHIYNKLCSTRSRLLSQKSNRRQRIGDQSYQILECVELEEATSYNCSCLPQIGCKVLKTKEKIPDTLTDFSIDIIQYVASVNGNIVFTSTKFEDVKYSSGNKYTSKKPKYYKKDGYLFFINISSIKAVTIKALFENPADASKFSNMCNDGSSTNSSNCIDILEKAFPIDDDLIDNLIRLTSDEVIMQFNVKKEDNTNNSNDK